MTHRDTAQSVREEASRWWVRLDGGDLSARERAEFEGWIAENPAHRATFADICALWGELDGLKGRFPASPKRPARHRPRLARWGLALAACLALLIVATPAWRADYRSGIGETRTLRLGDGSTVYLGSDTALNVDLGPDTRRLTLLRGEAWFEVARDPARPFVVEAGKGSATALGTVYDVRHVGGDVQVAVVESRVAVTHPRGPTLTLKAGQQTAYGRDYGPSPPRPVDIDTVSAWRRGRMVFENQPLGEVITELNRHHRGYIAITDAAIQKRPVSGVFRTDRPLEVVAALESSLGLRSTRLADYLVLLHR